MIGEGESCSSAPLRARDRDKEWTSAVLLIACVLGGEWEASGDQGE